MVKDCKDTIEIIRLWQEAFGDTQEDILFFLNNAKNAECLAYYIDETPVSMLFLVDCHLKGYRAKYLYAVCTAKDYRNKGYVSELLEYCKDNYNLLCLIPANDSLIDFYKSRNFDNEYDIGLLAFDETDEIREYLLDGYVLTEPKILCYNKGE